MCECIVPCRRDIEKVKENQGSKENPFLRLDRQESTFNEDLLGRDSKKEKKKIGENPRWNVDQAKLASMGRCTEGAMRPETDAERHTYIYIYIFFYIGEHVKNFTRFYVINIASIRFCLCLYFNWVKFRLVRSRPVLVLSIVSTLKHSFAIAFWNALRSLANARNIGFTCFYEDSSKRRVWWRELCIRCVSIWRVCKCWTNTRLSFRNKDTDSDVLGHKSTAGVWLWWSSGWNDIHSWDIRIFYARSDDIYTYPRSFSPPTNS